MGTGPRAEADVNGPPSTAADHSPCWHGGKAPGIGLVFDRTNSSMLGVGSACVCILLKLGFAPFQMQTAVIRTGGKQYRVAQGDTIRVEKLDGNPGDSVSFGEVLALEGDEPRFGTPVLEGVTVAGQIKSHGRGDKLVILKFKRRKRYRRKTGHRQAYTEIEVNDIVLPN